MSSVPRLVASAAAGLVFAIEHVFADVGGGDFRMHAAAMGELARDLKPLGVQRRDEIIEQIFTEDAQLFDRLADA